MIKQKNQAAVALGKLGGRVKSRKKTLASRRNGALGGRPKKVLRGGNMDGSSTKIFDSTYLGDSEDL